jgi:hypothetical protein
MYKDRIRASLIARSLTVFNLYLQKSDGQQKVLRRTDEMLKRIESVEHQTNDLNSKIESTEIWSSVALENAAYDIAVFGSVPLYRKNGLVEVFGGSLEQRAKGPISISGTYLYSDAQQMAVHWQPDYPQPLGSSTVSLRLNAPLMAGRLVIGIKTKAGDTYSFDLATGKQSEIEPTRPYFPVPEDLNWVFSETENRQPLTGVGGLTYSAALPSKLMKDLRNGGIVNYVVGLEHASGQVVDIESLGLVGVAVKNPGMSTVRGRIDGKLLPPGQTVKLRLENGETRYAQTADDNGFIFTQVPSSQPVSVSYIYEGQEYFSSIGRWFVADHDLRNVDIKLQPRFFAMGAHDPDAAQSKFVGQLQPSEVSALYGIHGRTYWTGHAGVIQNYESHTFTNNFGFIDRDRFFDNPSHCFRIVHLGSSHAVSLQVPIFEKYNIYLEEELGLKLQRCVEVISAGRDNGDLASNYPRIRDYAVKFSPDMILLENSTSLIMQMQPTLLKEAFGWVADHNALDGFKIDAEGELEFVPFDPNYGLHAVKPIYPEYVEGVRTFDLLKVDPEHLPDIAKDAFMRVGRIVNWIASQHPDIDFVVHNGLDQAQCASSDSGCAPYTVTVQGEPISVGVENFLKNNQQTCQEYGLTCFSLPFPDKPYGQFKGITWPGDGHYAPKGHQWLAKELSDKIVSYETEHAEGFK